MTVSTTKNRINQLADGVQTIFIYDFIVQEESQMQVYLDDVLQSTGYTVNGVGDDAGGDVTFDVAPDDGVTVTLQRLVDETQLVDYLPYDPFPAETHEDALDKLTLITQQNSDLGDRAVVAPVSDDGTTDYTMPVYDAGKGIMWDETDKKFTNSDNDLNSITADAQASADAAAVSEGNAATSESNAATSESNAATSESNASAFEDKAQEWAENPEDVPVEVGEFSALHWSTKAAASANTSADLATDVLGTDTYTATVGISSYTSGKTYYLSFANTNTVAAPTLEFDSLGAKTIKNLNGLALADGAIPDEGFVRYDGTDMILLNPIQVITGSTIIWNVDSVPAGYLEEDGSAISRAIYSNLFAVIGTQFGSGDGSTTFNLADKRGEFLRGWDNLAGNDPDAASRTDRGDGITGDNVGTKQLGTYESHEHGITTSAGQSAGTVTAVGWSAGQQTGPSTLRTGSFGALAAGGNETRPRNINIMYCIKY